LAAAANAIVISSAPADERWGALVEGHADLHPGVPVCVERRAGHRAGGPPLAAPPWAATTIDEDEPQVVVDIVDRLACLPRGAPLPASGVLRPKGRSALE
jgi:hypothetical protein